jgi:hypothetical protein
MEEPENSKPWFITHDGERTGPYSMDELKAKVELQEINPRIDMLWKDGMEDWVAAGEIEGLFEKNTKAEAGEKKDTKSAFTEFEYEDGSENNGENQEWEGVSRGGYFFFCFIFPSIFGVVLAFGAEMLQGVVGGDILPLIIGGLFLFLLLIVIFAQLKRFQNLAMSRLWFFGLFVPILQIWLGYRLFACPPGYAQHKKLGGLGWFLAIIYWLPLLAMIGLIAFIATMRPNMPKELLEKNRAQYEELILKAKELTQSPEEAEAKEAEQKAKEKAAKGPSIIPIPR